MTVYAWISLAPWVPTAKKDLERINKIADLKPGQTFLEIGCGNGRVCTYIAKENPENKIIGIELAFPFYLFVKIKTALFGPGNLEVIFGDALKFDISKVDSIYVFGLIETVNGVLKRKIEKEMPPNSKFISYVFSMKEWDGVQATYGGDKERKIHAYAKETP